MDRPSSQAGIDLLRTPLLGRFLRWKHARTAAQVLLLVLAALVLIDGFTGPPDGPRNVAGVAPWIQYRGFVALALLVVGNLFCFACPFMLPRRLAKRLLPADRPWPTWLRSKWLAAALLVVFLWAYEAFSLWASPWLTAWLVGAYFAAAFVIDGFFRGAAFCKYVCPIGQFNFVNSLASPTEVAIRDAGVCANCQTKDCITGRYAPAGAVAPPARGAGLKPSERGRLVQNGCELWLFQPMKTGNMDCTFCLDCVHACPYDNVGVLARVPARELLSDPYRSGVGRFGQRPDLAALAVVLVFGAFANAGGMIGPAQALKDRIAGVLGTAAPALVEGVVFLGALVVLPWLVVGAAATATRALTRSETGGRESVVRTATRFAYGLVPVGFGMWVAHYLYHFLGSGLTLVPVLQQFFADRGAAVLGRPNWMLGGVVPAPWLEPIEIVILEAGLLVSLAVLWGIARRAYGRAARRAFAPWAFVVLLLGAGGAWLLSQPMQMRGMEMPGMEMPGMDMPQTQTPAMKMPPAQNPGTDVPDTEGQAAAAMSSATGDGRGGSPR
ncbi:MAG: FesM [Gemmatimonadota bacterium]